MKNPVPYIRTQLIALLNNTITYNSVLVPAYSGEGEAEDRYQILISRQTWREKNDKHSFTKAYTQTVEIVSKQETDISTHVDAIAGEVMEILTPTPQTTGISDSADFQVMTVEADSPNYITEVADDGSYVNRLLIDYNFFINQK